MLECYVVHSYFHLKIRILLKSLLHFPLFKNTYSVSEVDQKCL